MKTVKTFKYLGSLFGANGGAEKDINNRIYRMPAQNGGKLLRQLESMRGNCTQLKSRNDETRSCYNVTINVDIEKRHTFTRWRNSSERKC